MTAVMTPKRYVSRPETAKIVRAALKAIYPTLKFSVRCQSYAGGGSLTIGWVDGPLVADIRDVVRQFEGSGFDGMIDMSYPIDAWILGGVIVGTRSHGTEGSRGIVGSWGLEAPHPDAELMHFSNSSILLDREVLA